jgi:hypothetical protein
MSVLKEFTSLASGPVTIGTAFSVQYRVEGEPPGGTIAVTCDGPYSASPDIPVTRLQGTARITIHGPKGAATVVVHGELVETHSFPQDVE